MKGGLVSLFQYIARTRLHLGAAIRAVLAGQEQPLQKADAERLKVILYSVPSLYSYTVLQPCINTRLKPKVSQECFEREEEQK